LNTTSLHILLQQYGPFAWSLSFTLYQDWEIKMKVKLNDTDKFYIEIPKEVLDNLDWNEGTEIKIEIARDFDQNATSLVITKKS
jgi:hypothetical protein